MCWRRLAGAGALDDRRAVLAMDDLRSMRIDRMPHGPLMERCWSLRDNLTVYDAMYVALAEAIDVVLLTADERLARSPGPRCRFELATSA
jgi:predicted nucleic acid-binding protein